MGTSQFKLVLVVRKDLSMGTGKIAAQCSHASIQAYKKCNKLLQFKWAMSGQMKVVVSCPDDKAMLEINEKAKSMNVRTSIIHDAGRTQIAPGSMTVLAVGPGRSEIVDQITGHLKLL